MKRKLSLILAVVFMIALFAGCAGGTTENGGNTGGTSNPSGTLNSSVSPEGTTTKTGPNKIVMAVAAVNTVDPHAKGGDNAYNVQVTQLYDTLVYMNTDGEFEGNLAESWEYSEDGLTWTFHLRDANFHDGTPVEAQDVVFSMERQIAIGQGYYYLFSEYVDNCEAVDAKTVKINMKQTYGPFLSSMCRLTIVNKDLTMEHLADGEYGEYKDYGMAWLEYNDAGSGPYVLKELRPQEGMSITKFDGYWGGWEDDCIDEAEILLVTEASTTRSMMINGELDFSTCFQSTESLQALDQIDGVDIGYAQSGGTYYLQLNTSVAPLDDVHIRKALAHLIDHEMITDVVFGSNYPNGVVSNATVGFTDQVTHYEYSIDKAREEIAQSKYADTIANYPIELYWLDSIPDEEKIGLALQAVGMDLGINIELIKTSWLNLTDKVGSAETTPAACIVSFSSKTSELCSVLLVKYHSKSQGTWNNTSWYTNTELDKMIDETVTILDDDDRNAKLAEIQKVISDELPVILLWSHSTKIAYNSGRIYWDIAEKTASGATAMNMSGNEYSLYRMRIK